MKSNLRQLVKNKLYTTVTVVGFAISLTFVLPLSVYIRNELSVDDFHVNKERIYPLSHKRNSFLSLGKRGVKKDEKQEPCINYS